MTRNPAASHEPARKWHTTHGTTHSEQRTQHSDNANESLLRTNLFYGIYPLSFFTRRINQNRPGVLSVRLVCSRSLWPRKSESAADDGGINSRRVARLISGRRPPTSARYMITFSLAYSDYSDFHSPGGAHQPNTSCRRTDGRPDSVPQEGYNNKTIFSLAAALIISYIKTHTYIYKFNPGSILAHLVCRSEQQRGRKLWEEALAGRPMDIMRP